ncbi:NapC/NirT family cytochrome c [Neobacillus sp. YIM B06451]|uniref:NapC/NirT family cytochrome c n=1 Tax=Neobacillus sp. YIM B06451 TaxID=3070994 RepID=UPI002931957A|nr:NapC/NirT family cytochrome c [Neobacillus sp. YIM B06451]
MFKKLLAIDKKILIFAALFAGIVLSAVTMKTLAYTDSPNFCQSCHIMDSAYGSFTDSTHSTLSCNDCHLPHDNVAKKLVFKGKAGMGHMYFNTLGKDKIPNVLHATEKTEMVVEQNCITCHESTLTNIEHDAKESCTTCHRTVPHGKNFKTKEFNKPPKSGELLEHKGGF